MIYRVLLATGDPAIAREFAAVAVEAGNVDLVDIIGSAGELVAALSTAPADVVVLHEDLGPLPVLDLARELTVRVPEVGLVMLARNAQQTLPSAALRVGFRGIIGLPLSLEDVATTVADTGAWAQAVRAKIERVDVDAADGAGTMLVVAGAKGGVGTTTIALHLALEAVRAGTQRRVCLVDFDLQAGDVRSYLDLTHRRSVVDLVEVADDLTGRQIDDGLYAHASGLRVLLPPAHGELAENVRGEAARRILAGIRSRFDVVIVDVGAVVTEGSAVAAEIADQVVVVVTPDVACLRAANRLLALWERLRIRKEDVGIIVNRASRKGEIQPDLVGKLVDATPLRTTVPADFRALEAATNTGVPDRLEDGRVSRALERVAEELRLVPPRRRGGGLWRQSQDQRGHITLDSAAMMLTIGLVILLLWELVLAGFTAVLSTHAAREAARELAVSELSGDELDAHLEEIVRSDLPSGWDEGPVDVEAIEDRVIVRLTVPAIVPRQWTPVQIDAEAGTVLESGGGGRAATPPAEPEDGP
jgi:pilus assembly protein CpaE